MNEYKEDEVVSIDESLLEEDEVVSIDESLLEWINAQLGTMSELKINTFYSRMSVINSTFVKVCQCKNSIDHLNKNRKIIYVCLFVLLSIAAFVFESLKVLDISNFFIGLFLLTFYYVYDSAFATQKKQIEIFLRSLERDWLACCVSLELLRYACYLKNEHEIYWDKSINYPYTYKEKLTSTTSKQYSTWVAIRAAVLKGVLKTNTPILPMGNYPFEASDFYN